MFSTLILLLKIKSFLSSTVFKVFTSITGAALKIAGAKHKKKFDIPKIIFKIAALILAPVFAISFLIPQDQSSPTANQNVIILSEEQKQQYIGAIENGQPVQWTGLAGSNQSGSSSGSNSFNGAVDNNYILDYDISKLTDTDIVRMKEYLEVCEEIANAKGVPVWVIMAINTLESAPLNLSESGVYVGKAQFDRGRTYGSVHPTTGKVINYRNYGKEETVADGFTDSSHYGPFQLDGNYGASDMYNFAISGQAAVNAQSDRIEKATSYFEGITSDQDFLWAIAITMHNTGVAGFKARVPRYGVDTRQHFYDSMMKIQTKSEFKDVSERMFKNWGSMENLRDMFMLFDGLPGIMYSKELVDDFGMSATSPIYNPDGTRIKSTPGAAGTAGPKEGTYTGDGAGETTRSQGFKIYMWEGKHGCVIGSVGETKYGWEFDYEAGRYLFGGFTKGKYLENTLRAAIKELGTTTTSSGTGFLGRVIERVKYYWRDNEVLADVENKPTRPVEGLFNEVGYKGTFPIFIQSSLSNDVSKTPWKFAGKETTLGASGCSLFTLANLIHGVGFGQDPIPIETNGTDGLNHHGYISLQNLAKALPNGPIIADDVSALGYIVKTVPTTDEGLEELYGYLKQGIPFAVNVRYGDITGYDYNYNKHTVHFTNEGHFILLVGAYELGGKRYVEVVQSIYSNGGQNKADQNALIFDFDELKDKQIIRSGNGYPVPAYTITGMRNSTKSPNYMKSDYTAPTRVEIGEYEQIANDTTQTDISVNSLVSSIKETGYIYLPKELYITVADGYIDIYLTDTTHLRISNFKLSNMISLSTTYEEGTYIGAVEADTIYEHYEGDTLIKQ